VFSIIYYKYLTLIDKNSKNHIAPQYVVYYLPLRFFFSYAVELFSDDGE